MKKTVSAGELLYYVKSSDSHESVLAYLGRSIGEDTYKQAVKMLRNIVIYNTKFETNLEELFPNAFSNRKVLKQDQIWSGLEAMFLLILMSRRSHVMKKGMNLYAILWREEDFFKSGARNDPYIEEKSFLIEGISEDVNYFRESLNLDHNKSDAIFDIRKKEDKLAVGENYAIFKGENNAGIRVNEMISEFMRPYASEPKRFDELMDLLIKMSARYIYYGLYEYFETNERINEINAKIKELEALKKAYRLQLRSYETSSSTPEQMMERFFKVSNMKEQ